jgi:hypothetical protein
VVSGVKERPPRFVRRGLTTHFALVVALATLAACSDSTKTTKSAYRTSPTTHPSETISSSRLLTTCEAGARAYNGVPIAAFKDPSAEGDVICWADGEVAKSPPPAADGTVRPPYDRLVFTARCDGAFVKLLRAGYRDRMKVTPPTG